MPYLTIARAGEPIEPSRQCACFADAFDYMHRTYGSDSTKYCKIPGVVWLNRHGVPRMVFDADRPAVRCVLPDAGGLMFFLDSDETFAAMRGSQPAEALAHMPSHD